MVDTQEARALFKGFRAEAAYLKQLLAVLETAVLVAPADNILRHHARQPGDASQQRDGGGVEIDADRVHAVFHHRVQLLRQQALADIMLILADADRFRIDFHQLRQRILQASCDRDRAAQRDVEIRELQRRQFRSGIDGGACFTDDHFLRGDMRILFLHVEEETLRLARGGAVADRHQLNLMFRAECSHHGRGFGCLAGMRINGIGSDQLAGGVHHGDFYAGAQAGIETHGGAHARRCRHQQIVQVAGEDVNRFVFGALAHRAHQLRLQVQHHLDAPGPAHHRLAPAVGRRAVEAQVKMLGDQRFAVAFARRLVELRIGVQRQL